MINVKNKYCQHHHPDDDENKKTKPCKNLALFGLVNKRPQFCFAHKKVNMINLVLENKCCILDCEKEYDHVIETLKYCTSHIPSYHYGMIVKRLCRYCDIKEDATFVCKDCKQIQNKKEWAIVRHLRKAIKTSFEYNSSKMLQGCSKKRPDIYFDLPTHCIIVEVDEHQHNTYEDICECARLNEIVNGIGGRPVIIIRYNPDTVRNRGKQQHIPQGEKIDLLVKTIKEELARSYDTFIVKIIQVYYNDNFEVYKPIKEENITDIVCI